MSMLVIDIPPQTRERLEEQARWAGKTIEALARELLETALETRRGNQTKTTRTVLQAADRVRPLSDTLRRKIIPDVTLEEVRLTLSQAAGPSLSDIISEHRGPKP